MAGNLAPQTPDLDREPLLSVPDIAERNGVPVSTVYRWRQNNYGPPMFKVGRHLRARLADVLAWEEEQLAKEAR